MPTRILLQLFLFLLSGLIAPSGAFALGVGQIEVRSALNQTFEAEFPLITSNPAELTGLVARIPRQEEFDRAGVERLELFSKLRFSVQTPPGGRSVVKITSLEPIREPNFNLLLELVWARGRLIREFTIQLDPELYANRRPPPPPPPVTLPPVVAPPVAAAPPPVVPQLPPAPPVSFEGASLYGPVKPGETLKAIANRVRPSTAINVPEMMAILVAGNPAAFAGGNPNTLRSGATLRVPTAQALGIAALPPSPTTLAAAPSTPEPAAVPELAPPPSPPSPLATAAPPPTAAPPSPEPSAVPPPSVTTSSPATPVAEGAQPPAAPLPVAGPVSPLPQVESPQEIVPKATIPQPEPAPAGQPQPSVATPAETPPAGQPQPSVVTPAETPPAGQPQPAAAPPPVVESSWLDSPVVWIAIVLIALAVAAVVLLPLLRRPAKLQPAGPAAAVESPESESTAVMEPREAPIVRTRTREPGSIRPRPAVGGAGGVPASTTAAKLAAGPGGAPTPKPIRELLKELDLGLDQGAMPAVEAHRGATPVRDIKAPLLEVEPPTAPVARQPVNQFMADSAESAAPEQKSQEKKEAPSPSPSELPSELQLDGLSFDFDDLAMSKAAWSQPAELPPLELGIAKPPAKPPAASVPADSAAVPAMKFEFADVTQELPKRAHEDLKLDEALQSFGSATLSLAGQEERASGVLGKGGMDAADYVETKLDLASAYLDMGDQVGARSLLDEVLQEGNAAQKARAGEFLKKLG